MTMTDASLGQLPMWTPSQVDSLSLFISPFFFLSIIVSCLIPHSLLDRGSVSSLPPCPGMTSFPMVHQSRNIVPVPAIPPRRHRVRLRIRGEIRSPITARSAWFLCFFSVESM
ncbi:uncharacterized protein BDW43DRAFT_285973 [Aspergillus alliaceus]|uniref:uncharacterized protein n=1 Tax=Petromyces alliaceus TaxID=209559 RepID=UPI0012A3CF14|nr:uncharacterized protein BDW43DRAFT_285973 [Aspergillus alliaceus]KAB8230268.1 hypothetical protein BDW43DRAFT_285973 [Aspergillus alliaceus]